MSGYGDKQFPFVAVILELDEADLALIAQGTRHILLSWQGKYMPVFIVPEMIEGRTDAD